VHGALSRKVLEMLYPAVPAIFMAFAMAFAGKKTTCLNLPEGSSAFSSNWTAAG